MENPLRTRRTLEQIWMERTQFALTHYREAKAATRAAEDDHGDTLRRQPDGSFAVRRALQMETAALQEYRRVLELFNNLVIYGKVPPDGTK
jgi:hypothetical protein